MPTTAAARRHLRETLIALAVLAALTVGFFFVSPRVLPVYVVEGPLVQQPTDTAATLIWYTSRPVTCTLTVERAGANSLRFTTETATRHRVRVDGLDPETDHPYAIRVGQRTLATAALRTNTQPNHQYQFVVFGDSGKGTQAQYRLAREMAARSPDFLLHTGDLVYSDGARENYRYRFFLPYRDMLEQVGFWPCLGNHDVTDSIDPYVEVFELPENGPAAAPPETNYWFDYANARIAVLDSNVSEEMLATVAAPWLAAVFADCPAQWRFVSLHHPPYTGGAHAPDLSVRQTLGPVFEAAHVDIVFCGHDHLYQRLAPLRGGEIVDDAAGVRYIVTGAGGARLYKPDAKPRPPYVEMLHHEQHSFTFVSINGSALTLQQVGVDGTILDRWSRDKAPVPATQPSAAAGAADYSASVAGVTGATRAE